MRRIISLCCVALICVLSLAPPVNAAGSNFIEVLDYGGIDGGNVYFFTSPAGGRTVSLNLPAYGAVYYYDLLIRYSGSAPTAIFASIGSTNTPLTIVQVGSGLIRAYASSTGGSGDKITLSFTHTNASYIELKSLRVSTLKADHFSIDSYCQISSVSYNDTIIFRPTDTTNHRYIDATEFDPLSSQFTLALTVTDWQKYDYIDFELYVSVNSLTSLSSSHGSIVINSIVNETENTVNAVNDYRIYCTLDLTGLDKTSDIIPSILITGNWAVGWVNYIAMVGTSGFVEIAARNPFTTLLINIVTAINNGFTNLNLWVDAQTSALVQSIVDAKNAIVEAIKGDTSSGDQFQDDVQDEIDELEEQQAIIDSVTKPDISNIDVNVDQYVSPTNIRLLTSPVVLFFENSIFSSIFIMSILLATVSYTLYGKK